MSGNRGHEGNKKADELIRKGAWTSFIGLEPTCVSNLYQELSEEEELANVKTVTVNRWREASFQHNQKFSRYVNSLSRHKLSKILSFVTRMEHSNLMVVWNAGIVTNTYS